MGWEGETYHPTLTKHTESLSQANMKVLQTPRQVGCTCIAKSAAKQFSSRIMFNSFCSVFGFGSPRNISDHWVNADEMSLTIVFWASSWWFRSTGLFPALYNCWFSSCSYIMVKLDLFSTLVILLSYSYLYLSSLLLPKSNITPCSYSFAYQKICW